MRQDQRLAFFPSPLPVSCFVIKLSLLPFTFRFLTLWFLFRGGDLF